MDLYKEILIEILSKKDCQVTFPNLVLTPAEIVDSVSYRALKKIKAVLEDDSHCDRECFAQVEEIVCIYESIGSGGGFRHDF